jgi:small redox-active disulfide protein 2
VRGCGVFTAALSSSERKTLMMKIQILGPGCGKCQRLAENAQTAANELGIPYELEKVTSLEGIMSFGVMMTPALAVNGQVKSSGKLLSSAEIKAFLA